MQHNFSTSRFFSIVFWACRGCNPAADLGFLLILAGDVETNPGPDIINKCYTCGYPFKKNQNPLVCSFNGCTNKSHKQTKCSDTKAGSDTTEWICNQHSDDDVLLESVRLIELPSDAEPPRQCDSCGSALRIDYDARHCFVPGCLNRCHFICSGISRYNHIDVWKCKAHNPDPSSSAAIAAAPDPANA
jgi:hypothetical protein